MKKLYFIILGALLLSCEDFFEQEVNVDIPDHDPKLVLYSYAAPGDSLIILLTRSVGVEVPANLWEMWMSSAQVEVEKNGIDIPVELNTSEQFLPFFVAITDLQPNDHLTVRASSEGYQSVSAEVIIPSPPLIADANYAGRRINVEGDEFAAFKFTITDEVDVDNYYEVSVVSEWTNSPDDVQEFLGATNYDSNLPWINPPSDDGFNLRLFFEDGAFENDEVTVEFLADVWELANPEYYNPEYNTGYYLSVKSVTKTYYDFVTAFGAHEDNQFPDLFSGEPVPLPTNITNGLGVFGAYSESRIKIDLGELEN